VPLSRDSRDEKKFKALRLAEFRLKQRFEMIDFLEDELYPFIEDLKAGRSVLSLPEGAAFEIIVEPTCASSSAKKRKSKLKPTRSMSSQRPSA